MPANWNYYRPEIGRYGEGYATYRLRIRLSEPGRYLAIKVPDVATAYNLYVNGELLRSVGVVGRTPAESKPHYLPQIASFYTDARDIELIMQVANFAHHKGGIKDSLYFGPEEAVHRLREKQLGFELFLLGTFLIMTLYHFGLYLLRRQDKPALYFGLFCLLIAIRTMTTGEMVIMQIFPALAWELLLKTEYLSYYLAVPIFVKFVYHLYAADTPPKVTNTIRLVSLPFAASVIVMPVKYYARTLIWYDIFTLLACIYVGRVLFKAVAEEKEGATGFTLGVLILQGTVINDILFSNGLISSGNMVPLGLFIFIFFQALALSLRFSRAYLTLETLSDELRQSNEKIKEQVRLLDLDPDYTIERSLEGNIVFWNHGAELGYKWSKEEAEGKEVFVLLRTQFPKPLREINAELMRHGRWMGELVQTRRDGVEMVVRSCWLLKCGMDGRPVGVLELNKDISEQKNMEKELVRLERLNLIGQMAAGISHEVRNPMTTVRGFLQLLDTKEQDAEKREYYALMISELDRANDILTEYLSIARTKSSNLKLQDINAILMFLQPLLKAEELKTGKAIIFDLREVPELLLDDGEIRQLVLNLCRNGLEAMEEKGKTLTITTVSQGEAVILSVRDEGSGISKELMGTLGMPFSTTKDNGTGLGLAVCYGIAARHKATIEVSTGADGTTFLVKFKRNVCILRQDAAKPNDPRLPEM